MRHVGLLDTQTHLVPLRDAHPLSLTQFASRLSSPASIPPLKQRRPCLTLLDAEPLKAMSHPTGRRASQARPCLTLLDAEPLRAMSHPTGRRASQGHVSPWTQSLSRPRSRLANATRQAISGASRDNVRPRDEEKQGVVCVDVTCPLLLLTDVRSFIRKDWDARMTASGLK